MVSTSPRVTRFLARDLPGALGVFDSGVRRFAQDDGDFRMGAET